MFKKSKIIILLLFFISGFFIPTGSERQPVEELGVASSFGMDMIKKSETDFEYIISFSELNFMENKVNSRVVEATASTIGGSRGTRQAKTGKKTVLGQEKVFVFHEDMMEYGIKNAMDIVMVNPSINDTAFIVVSKQTPVEILKLRIQGYPSSGDYIDGLIENARNYNFYPKNFRIIDMFVRMDGEGRNIVLPYIEIVNGNLEITGLALIKGDKMVAKADMENSKILSILKESNTRGIFTLQENKYESLDFQAVSKRKVYCEKKENKYFFKIKLNIKGDILANEMYSKISSSDKTIEKFEKDMEKYITDRCERFIEKMQQEYKIDCLGLGKFAAAKYGRNTGVDWNKVVSEADIQFDIDVKLLNQGRGNY